MQLLTVQMKRWILYPRARVRLQSGKKKSSSGSGHSAKNMCKRSRQPQCLPFSTQSHCRCLVFISTEKPRRQRSLVCTKPLKIKCLLLTKWNKSTVACSSSTLTILNIKALLVWELKGCCTPQNTKEQQWELRIVGIVRFCDSDCICCLELQEQSDCPSCHFLIKQVPAGNMRQGEI